MQKFPLLEDPAPTGGGDRLSDATLGVEKIELIVILVFRESKKKVNGN